MVDLSENSENFIVKAKQDPSPEIDKELLDILEQGINPDYIRYFDGYQRMGDGRRWGNGYYFLMYVLRYCSLDVMKKVFEKYPQIIRQVDTYTHDTYSGYSDAYWIRGLNDANGETPVVRDAEIANFLLDKLPDYDTACLRNVFAKLSFDDCLKLLADPNFPEGKKSVLLAWKSFDIQTKKELLSLRPYLDKIQRVAIDLQKLSNQEVLSFLPDMKKLRRIDFANFPGKGEDQEALVQILADMKDPSINAEDADNKYVDVKKLINEERQKRVEAENEGKADWKVDFLKKCSVKDFRSALNILKKAGVLSVREQDSHSSFGREFDHSQLGWGNNSLEVHNDLVAVDIKEIGNDSFAVGQIYEDRSWRSTVGYSSGIGWYWKGDLAVVNLDKGVGAVANTNTICVRDPENAARDIFGNIPQKDFVSVRGNKAHISLGGYASADVEIPKDMKPAAKEEPKKQQKGKPATPKKKEVVKKSGIRKKLDLFKKAKLLDEASASLRHEREGLLEDATAGIKDAKQRSAVRRRIDVSDLRIKEDKVRAAKLGQLLKNKQKQK